ncbi:peptidase S8 and S53 [Patulibacter medicamentivorans]|uniref:Peptidase S8 and S53 n=1 Tax=Patulibacter medicamentivorans TaxID=1097667 RepID=H0E5T2_9ACTN|nr:S8 family serine peptidase [Patulibacter medicamentivorans]EHN10952.1 peptidase S8 and S53 [Patulibacter medicamentivorans]
MTGRGVVALAGALAVVAVGATAAVAPAAAVTAPDDPAFDQQWALRAGGGTVEDGRGGTGRAVAGADVGALEAWSIARGAGQTVAVVDTGVTSTVPDLRGRLATADGAPGQGQPDSDPSGHGTVVATVLAADADDRTGIAGIAPQATVLSLPALGGLWPGPNAIAEALAYAGDRGVPVVNVSIVENAPSAAISQAIAAHPGTLYVAAAGNGETTESELGIVAHGEQGVDIDARPTFPCALDLPNVICVGASDLNGNRAWFANYGRTGVDLLAPGVAIYATRGAGELVAASGSSVAAPLVSGTLALMRQANPSLDPAALKATLLATVRRAPALATATVSGGRLDAAAAVRTAAQKPGGLLAGPPKLDRVRLSRRTLVDCRPKRRGCTTRPARLTWRVSMAGSLRIRVLRRSGGRWKPAATTTRAAVAGNGRYDLRGRIGARSLAAGSYRVAVRARSDAGRWSAESTLRLTVRR